MKNLLFLAIALGLTAACASADSGTLIVGGPVAPGDGNSYPFGAAYVGATHSAEFQEVYDSSSFTSLGTIMISKLQFYNTAVGTTATQMNSGTFTISLSTTPANHTTLSPTFASNFGTNTVQVFSGSLAQPWTFGDTLTITLNTPYTYNPANGNLLMDVVTSNTGDANGAISFDENSGTPKVAARAYCEISGCTTGFVDTGGVLVTGFVYTSLPPTGPITVTTNPPGLSITVDGGTYIAPQDFNWAPGTDHTVDVTSPQGGPTMYFYTGWSDGGAQSHAIVAPNSNTTYTASFAAGEFIDVTPDLTYFAAANLMFQAGVTTGCVQSSDPSARQFCPSNDVTRQELAAFIVRAVTGTVTPTVYNPAPYFQDVPTSNPFFPHIQKLVDLGITTGCSTSPALYCPTDNIPRWEMAIFMVRARLALYGATFTTATTPYFTDVPTNVEGSGQPFPFIQRSYEEHITNGCGGTQYCPDQLVTRGQMASFIMRGLFNETMVVAANAPQLTSAIPNTVPQTAGSQITVTITGTNTNFQPGDTVTVPSGMLSVSNVVVNSATLITATLTVKANAVGGPQALVVATGGQNITLPLAIRVGTY
jgi:hypothetical protein